MVIIDGDGDGDVEESLNLGGREAFVRVCGRHNNICVSGSTVVGGDASFGWKGALSAVWGATRYYLFIMTKRSGQGSIHGNYAVITVISSC